MRPAETLCSLVLDEMSITPGCQWDVKSDSFIGAITLGSQEAARGTKATKCLVFLLAGLSVRWKQVVYYHFTGKNKVIYMYRVKGKICCFLTAGKKIRGMKIDLT